MFRGFSLSKLQWSLIGNKSLFVFSENFHQSLVNLIADVRPVFWHFLKYSEQIVLKMEALQGVMKLMAEEYWTVHSLLEENAGDWNTPGPLEAGSTSKEKKTWRHTGNFCSLPVKYYLWFCGSPFSGKWENSSSRRFMPGHNAEITDFTSTKHDCRQTCQYCISIGPTHSGVWNEGGCLISEITSARFLWTIPEMTKYSQTLYEGGEVHRNVSEPSHWAGPS